MTDIHEPQLVNTVGHSAGAIIFGIFLYLLLRDRSGARLRGSWLSVAAAGLAFLWNAGSLAVLIASAGNSRPHLFRGNGRELSASGLTCAAGGRST